MCLGSCDFLARQRGCAFRSSRDGAGGAHIRGTERRGARRRFGRAQPHPRRHPRAVRRGHLVAYGGRGRPGGGRPGDPDAGRHGLARVRRRPSSERAFGDSPASVGRRSISPAEALRCEAWSTASCPRRTRSISRLPCASISSGARCRSPGSLWDGAHRRGRKARSASWCQKARSCATTRRVGSSRPPPARARPLGRRGPRHSRKGRRGDPLAGGSAGRRRDRRRPGRLPEGAAIETHS